MKRLPAFLLALATLAACSGKKETKLPIATETVQRRDIVVDASATGAVEPINVVEVKSKASGLITKMPVETGTLVKPGDLLVQLDTRDVQAQFDQANADLTAAREKLRVSEAQKKRNDDLFAQRIITAAEHETSQLDYASATASMVRAQASLDLAQQRLDDATVTAPVIGTVIEKTVSLGQVIVSATNSASGGTTLLKMADLNKVRVRALFNESDIGAIRAGLQATVTVDAYPDRPFAGSVEKIEPQAVVQQSVTMFPVLVSLENLEGLLKPGMNGEVAVLIDRRTNVLAIPNDAIRNVREAATVAAGLGLDPDSVQAQLRAQGGGGFGGGNGGGGFPGGNGRRGGRGDGGGSARGEVSRGEVALAEDPQGDQGGQGGGRQGRGRGPQIEVTDKDCAAVTAAFAKHPDAEKQLSGLRDRMQKGELDFQQMREETQKIYATVGVDSRVAGACRQRERGRNGQSGGDQGGQAQGGQAQGGRAQGGRGQSGANPELSTPVQAGEFSNRSRARTGLVFLAENNTYVPRVVRLGVGNFDYTEVLSGVKEGDKVALLAAAAMQARRDEQNNRTRNMMGGGVPGMSRGANGPNIPGPGRGGR